MIPLHSEPIASGFPGYTVARKKAGDRRLFPQVISERSEVTAAWSKWWGRYARKHGLSDKRKVFHSFRHTFKDACRAAGIEEATYDAIQGHGAGGAGRGYGLGYPLPELSKAVEKVCLGQKLTLSFTEIAPESSDPLVRLASPLALSSG
jgi:integrase